MEINSAIDYFKQNFGNEFIISRAPGRINLIGEHTDYNEGYVLPAAIDRYVFCILKKNSLNKIRAIAYDLNENEEIELNQLSSNKSWMHFVIGMTLEMMNCGVTISGYDLLITSNVPLGAGLSSSAALESALGTGLNQIFDGSVSKKQIGLNGQSTEHKYVGVKCGIMDQFASIFGEKDHALLLDCRSQQIRKVPIKFNEYCLILINSEVKHSLASSEYNLRRKDCENGVKILNKLGIKGKSLREINLNDVNTNKHHLGEINWKRCSYVIEENNRVLEAVAYLETNHVREFGKLLYEAHKGISKKYEVSCPELDFLVESTNSMEYVLGARMMGGGFGGCTINLVEKANIKTFISNITSAYTNEFNIVPSNLLVEIVDGAKIVNDDL